MTTCYHHSCAVTVAVLAKNVYMLRGRQVEKVVFSLEKKPKYMICDAILNHHAKATAGKSLEGEKRGTHSSLSVTKPL